MADYTIDNSEELEELALTEDTEKFIKEKVAELRKADPKLRAIYPIVVQGDPDYDDKAQYVIFLRQPGLTSFLKYANLAQKTSTAQAMRQLATESYLAGDKELIDDDSLFVYGLMPQMGEIITARQGRVVNLSKARK